ncbi:unnamed protein product [Pleuronectes platessa]|uniref:Uncharacterized protein n=1 Tax=Pleuronectes platessa TaxID=8262 RepID=A0A9N7YSV6_PLEPL|nr:unnamed protein product [Pleuronectes platessa]
MLNSSSSLANVAKRRQSRAYKKTGQGNVFSSYLSRSRHVGEAAIFTEMHSSEDEWSGFHLQHESVGLLNSHSPLSLHLHLVKAESQDSAGPPSLSSLLLSAVQMLLPQHITPKKMGDTTSEAERASRSNTLQALHK